MNKMATFPALLGLLFVCLVSGQGVDITPREAVRRVGDEVTVLCKVAYPIDSCRMTVGQVTYRLIPNNLQGDVIYSGRGLEVGECGARIRNISPEMSGAVTCVLPPSSGNIEVTGRMTLLVASAPEPPQLVVMSSEPTAREGESLEAQCLVKNGRPAAKITWFLDEVPLVEGLHQPTVTTASALWSVSQNVTRVLTAEDAGRTLVCRAEHAAWDQPRDARRQLSVVYPPKRLESGTITIFGLKLGEEGRLNVTVRANPVPQVEWTVGDRRLTPGSISEDGTIVALEPIALGNGYYNCSLVLSRVVKEDVDRTYYLRAANQLGSEEFAVRLSTMDEPAGVELGTGAIVGIVIAVLILLTAVFLIVFAKATDRWCFGGRSHRSDIPDGADSEAPLPPPRDDCGAENPTHDHHYISNENFRLRRDQTKNSGESTPAGDVLLEARIQPTSHTSETESAGGAGGAAGAGGAGGRLAALRARVRAALPRSKDKVQATETEKADEKPLSDEKKNVVYAELALGEGRDKPPPDATEYAQIVYTAETTPSATAPAPVPAPTGDNTN